MRMPPIRRNDISTHFESKRAFPSRCGGGAWDPRAQRLRPQNQMLRFCPVHVKSLALRLLPLRARIPLSTRAKRLKGGASSQLRRHPRARRALPPRLAIPQLALASGECGSRRCDSAAGASGALWRGHTRAVHRHRSVAREPGPPRCCFSSLRAPGARAGWAWEARRAGCLTSVAHPISAPGIA
eukprot:2936001-Rhodomonas_salina.1